MLTKTKIAPSPAPPVRHIRLTRPELDALVRAARNETLRLGMEVEASGGHPVWRARAEVLASALRKLVEY